MLLAQLTDTHILAPDTDTEHWVDNNGRLAMAVSSLNAETVRPTAILATGDLTNNAEPGEIDELVRLLEPLEIPILALPGNHDDRAEIAAAFDLPWAAPDNLSWVIDVEGLAVVGLDTSVPGEHHGDFDEAREAWLVNALAATAERPTVVAMHHPPFASGVGWMDETILRRADVFEAVIAANPHVTRIFCGHLHRPLLTTVGGVTTSAGLSTVHHIGLDLAEGAPTTIIRDPAGYQLHHFDGQRWVTNTRYIGTGESAFVPSWADEA